MKAMISIFLGDPEKTRKAMNEAIEKAKGEEYPANITRFDDITFDTLSAESVLGSTSMFGGANIVIFDGVSGHTEGKEYLGRLAKRKVNGDLIFIREKTLEKETEKSFAHANIRRFDEKPKPIVKNNNFVIADCYAKRDKKGAWVGLEKARREGASAEEIHGMLFWAAKSLRIAGSLSKGEAAKSGMKEYTYTNYARYAKGFTEEEILGRLAELKDMFHDAHSGMTDFDAAIERFLLR